MDATTTAAIIVLPVAAFLLVFAFLWWCLFPSSDEETAKENKSYVSQEPWIAQTVSREESDAASPSFDLEDPGTATTNVQRVEDEQKHSPVRKSVSLRSPRWRTRKTPSMKHANQSSDLALSEVDEDVARSVDNEELTLDEDDVVNRRSPSRVIRKLFQSSSVNEGNKSMEIPQVFSSGVNVHDEASHPDDEITIGELNVDGMDGTLASRDIYTTM